MAQFVYRYCTLLVKINIILRKVQQKGLVYKNLILIFFIYKNKFILKNMKLFYRWRPVLGVKEILISVISILNDPNIDSPANIDAAVY